jgi:hypothetical protein
MPARTNTINIAKKINAKDGSFSSALPCGFSGSAMSATSFQLDIGARLSLLYYTIVACGAAYPGTCTCEGGEVMQAGTFWLVFFSFFLSLTVLLYMMFQVGNRNNQAMLIAARG